ncbi:hypothetical protein CJP72_24870 [Citrobacter sp. NCU1]|nr:hypothetical protein [Citrobacter sp. NCU1]
MKFSFPAQTCSPHLVLLNDIARRYTSLLAELLVKQQLPETWVKAVCITLDFDVIADTAQLYDSPTQGEPFKRLGQRVEDNGQRLFSLICDRC